MSEDVHKCAHITPPSGKASSLVGGNWAMELAPDERVHRLSKNPDQQFESTSLASNGLVPLGRAYTETEQ